MKKLFYKVIFDKEHWWVSSAEDLRSSVIEWVNDSNGLKIEPVLMTQEEFDKMPEFEG